MKKYQLTQFCPNDQAIENRLRDYLLMVGLNLKTFGQPLGRINLEIQKSLGRMISKLQNFRIHNSTLDNKQDPNNNEDDDDFLNFFLRN